MYFFRCAESPYPGAEACTCLDCEAACELNVVSPPPLPEEPQAWMIMNYDGISIICFLVFCVCSAFLLLSFLYFRIQSRKKLQCKFSLQETLT